MRKLLSCWALASLLASACLGPYLARAQAPVPVLIAEPTEGHTGDTVFLSGSGFPPGAQPSIALACPDWSNNPHGNISLIAGPVADARGRFVAFAALRAMTLVGVQSSPCHIYASYGINPLGPYALYTIKAPEEQLDQCARVICVKADAVLSGSKVKITVTGWPGARTVIKITYPSGKVQKLKMQLSWKGQGLLRATVEERVTSGSPAHYQVQASLNHISGIAKGHFPPGLPAKRA